MYMYVQDTDVLHSSGLPSSPFYSHLVLAMLTWKLSLENPGHLHWKTLYSTRLSSLSQWSQIQPPQRFHQKVCNNVA